MRKRIQTNRIEAEKLCKSLAQNKVSPNDVAGTIQSIDKLYDSIFKDLPEVWARASSIDPKEYYLKLKYAFYTYLAKRESTIHWWTIPDEDKTINDVDNALHVGFSQQFKLYLRERNNYILRARQFLATLSVQVNGHGKDALSFQQTQLRSADTISAIKKVVELDASATDAQVLDAYIRVRQLMTHLPPQLEILFARQKEILVGFGFLEQMELRSAARMA